MDSPLSSSPPSSYFLNAQSPTLSAEFSHSQRAHLFSYDEERYVDSNDNQDDNEEDDDNSNQESDLNVEDAAREQAALTAYRTMHPEKEQREIGGREIDNHEAIWSVSSFRPHWGADKLRDNNPFSYWQSDSSDAKKHHTIDITFHQATLVSQVSLFIDFFQDETYTPKTVMVRGGNTYRDLQEITTVECPEFVGWVNIDLLSATDGIPFRVFKLQIAILNTHLNGKDTHVRQVKVYSLIP
ncbi:hypothetical protein RMATCC62417_15601 [Rhizopus microsporus]|nr:hypothetical protein RMATCC62417_15601 [Rhizopus microsporus]